VAEPFRGPEWPPERRREVIRLAVGIVSDHVEYGVGRSVVLEHIPRIIRLARDQVGENDPLPLFQGHFAMMFPEVLAALEEDLEKVAAFHGDPVELYFDRKEKTTGLLTGYLEEFLALHSRLRRFVSVRSVSKDDFLPIQAADILAYELTKHIYNKLHDPERPARKSYEALQAKGRIDFGYWFLRPGDPID
jgi:hypothetical protein